MMRGIHGNQKRFEETYFKPYKGYYFAGDGARRDADGCYYITGTPCLCGTVRRMQGMQQRSSAVHVALHPAGIQVWPERQSPRPVNIRDRLAVACD